MVRALADHFDVTCSDIILLPHHDNYPRYYVAGLTLTECTRTYLIPIFQRSLQSHIPTMPKRKSSHVDGTAQDVTPRRSTRQRTSTLAAQNAAATSSTTPRSVVKEESKPAGSSSKPPATKSKAKGRKDLENDGVSQPAPKKETDGSVPGVKDTSVKAKSSRNSDLVIKASGPDLGSAPPQTSSSGRQYWLLKAEPASRFENGVDVKFSIDDLAAKTEPEPWDGMLVPPL